MLKCKLMELRKRIKSIRLGKTQRKILLILGGGMLLGLSRSPKQYFEIIKALRKEWTNINEQALERSLRSLKNLKLIEQHSLPNGELSFQVSNKGERYALAFNIFEIRLTKSKTWDGKWRIVLFDIPEKYKKVRDALRYHIKKLGFHELQKSVFVL